MTERSLARESEIHEPIPVSVMIFTLNEEVHLPHCLKALQVFDDVIVIDSFSTDETRAICETQGVRFFQHDFEGFGSQRNWAIDHVNPKYPWLLVLDADEIVPPELAEELGRAVDQAGDDISAFRLRRRFHMWEKWLRYSSLYPTWVVRLIHKDRVRYVNRGHSETQEVQGLIADLQNDLIDENRKGIDEWFERQNRYSRKDAEYESEQQAEGIWPAGIFSLEPLSRRAALKTFAYRMPMRGLMYFLYSYFLRRGFLDGREGFYFCLMRAMYQTQISIKKFDMKIKGKL